MIAESWATLTPTVVAAVRFWPIARMALPTSVKRSNAQKPAISKSASSPAISFTWTSVTLPTTSDALV